MNFADIAESERSALMRSVRSKNTKPEIIVRKALFARGFRYRIHVRTLPGTPDIVLPKWKAAIQVRGCFWHSHGCSRNRRKGEKPWSEKLKKNVERDEISDKLLSELGWSVIVVWECDLESRVKREKCMEKVVSKICR